MPPIPNNLKKMKKVFFRVMLCLAFLFDLWKWGRVLQDEFSVFFSFKFSTLSVSELVRFDFSSLRRLWRKKSFPRRVPVPPSSSWSHSVLPHFGTNSWSEMRVEREGTRKVLEKWKTWSGEASERQFSTLSRTSFNFSSKPKLKIGGFKGSENYYELW